MDDLRRLSGDRRGALLLVIAFALLPLIAALGLAADAARGYAVKEKLSRALDIAALAGAQVMHKPDQIQPELAMFFAANFPATFMSATVTGPEFTVDQQGSRLRVTAHATIPTSFMSVLGFETIDVAAITEVVNTKKTIDVVLAVDMSGSMGWDIAGNSGAPEEQTRIYAAREAAKELVEALFTENPSAELLKIGVVPWNAKVNVTLNGVSFDSGATISEPVATFTSTPTWNNPTGGPQSVVYYANNSPVPLMSAPPSGWAGCVYARFVDDSSTDNDADILYGAHDSGDGDWRAWEPAGPEAEPVSGSANCAMASGGNECTACLSHGITPLTDDKQAVLDAVDELLVPEGATNITQGFGWAWRVLMPDEPFAQAVSDDEAIGDRIQVIVLLTDGENQPAAGDGYKAAWGTGSTAQTNMDNRLQLLASNVKNSGVEVYTIQFANGSTSLATLMQSVASSSDAPYYHYAPTPETLRAAFKQVANHISDLRITQ